MSDPGGYFTYYLGGRFLSVLTLADIAIIPILLCLYRVKSKNKIIHNDRFFTSFLKVFSVFALYYFIVYGAVIPYFNNDLDYMVFLQKNRFFYYYIIVLISTYVFALRGLKYFYLTTVFISSFVLVAYLITLATGFNLVPVMVFERYEGDEMMRLSIYSWGLISIMFPFSFILFSSSYRIKKNIKYKSLIYSAGILMVLTLLITLSRRYVISIPGTLILIILICSYIFRKSRAVGIAKILVPLGIILIIINLVLPKYVDYIADISQDTFLVLTRGTDTRGEQEYRVSGTSDLEITKKYIGENFIFGTGYSYLYWGKGGYAQSSRGDKYAAAMDAANEVPVYYIFFGYGLAGLVIMIFLYSFLIRLFLRLFSIMRKRISILMEYPYEVLFAIYFLYFIADKFTYSFWSLGKDFVIPTSGMFISIGFALYKKFKRISSDSRIVADSKSISEEHLVNDISNN